MSVQSTWKKKSVISAAVDETVLVWAPWYLLSVSSRDLCQRVVKVLKWPHKRRACKKKKQHDHKLFKQKKKRFPSAHYKLSLVRLVMKSRWPWVNCHKGINDRNWFKEGFFFSRSADVRRGQTWTKIKTKPQKNEIFPEFLIDRTDRNVGQQNSRLCIGLTLQASTRWCFNNKYLGRAPLNWIILVQSLQLFWTVSS